MHSPNQSCCFCNNVLCDIKFFIKYRSLLYIFSYVIAYELFDIDKGDKLPLFKYIYKIGYWCQQKLFTLEPSDVQIKTFIGTLNVLLELESMESR